MVGITSEQYNDQIPLLSEKISRSPGVQNIITTTDDNNNKQLEFTLFYDKIQPKVLIRFHPNYQEPTVYFQIYKLTSSDPEEWTLSFDNNLVPPTEMFSITMTQHNSQNWWFIHPCDTTQLLRNSPTKDYLVNWGSLYLRPLMKVNIEDWFPQ